MNNEVMEDNWDKTEFTPQEGLAELQKAIEYVLTGKRDPEVMRKACERMDRMSAEIYKKHGLLDIGVPAIRELRETPRLWMQDE